MQHCCTDSLNNIPSDFEFKVFHFPQTFCLTKACDPNLTYYLLIVLWRREGFVSFLVALAQRETQTDQEFEPVSSIPFFLRR